MARNSNDTEKQEENRKRRRRRRTSEKKREKEKGRERERWEVKKVEKKVKDIGEGVQKYETTLVIWTIVSESRSQLYCESNVTLVAQKNEVWFSSINFLKEKLKG